MKRLVNMIKEMPEELHVSKVDFLLTILISAVSGIIVGMLISPRSEIRLGGKYNCTDYYEALDEEV